MNAASMSSKRLKRVLAALQGARELSTRQIVERAQVMAVSACVAELREHGHVILCRRVMRKNAPVWLYSLVRAA